ncbi:phage tail protein [Novosphingobium fluoreni]|uniref:phage tail protein n=1 Tax=Novosphingobium fluoreni TaxID=1391222 RepID=UPI003DA1C48B
MTRVAVGNSAILYGERRPVSTQLIFYHPVGKNYRYFVLAVAGHRCKGVKQWMLNDEKVTVNPSTGQVLSGKYAANAWLWFARGTDDQEANPTFVAECGGKWTAQHRGRGVALIYAKFKMTDDVVQAGMPLIAPVIEGKDDVRDPRTGDRGYTRLATPIIYDWMAMPREEGGFGAAPDEIPDDDLLSAWTNICDEGVAIPGGSEKRYRLDASFLTGSAPSEVRQTFQICCAGTYTYSSGKFLMRPGYWNPPSATLSENDLAGGIVVPMLADPQEVATEVNGTFVDPAANFQPQPIPVRSRPAADLRQMDVDLAHVTSSYQGQRILEIMLRRAQCEKKVTWPMNIAGLAVQAMDTVQLGTARYGLSNYAFVVDGWGMSQDFGVALQLREENADIYSDAITYGSSTTPPALDQGDVIDDAPAPRGAFRVTLLDPAYPVSSDDESITVTAASAVLDDGRTIALPSSSIAGLDKATSYGLFWNLTASAYEVEAYPAATRMASAGYVFIVWQSTLNADGTAPAGDTPPPGYGGGGYTPNTVMP